MKNQKWIIFSVALVLIAGTVGILQWLRTHQKLGNPGIKATPISGEVAMKIELPDDVPGFNSTNVPESDIELGYFPKDTSYIRRCYLTDDLPPIFATIVMMGADRTSIHKPNYCLPGQGFKILKKSVVDIPIVGTNYNYNLPVAKWLVSHPIQMPNGEQQTIHAFYMFWFVADNEQTPSFYQRLWWLTRDLLHTGVLQRWAYVSYYAPCMPGQEDATFARVERLIAASVPEFQLPPHKR